MLSIPVANEHVIEARAFHTTLGLQGAVTGSLMGSWNIRGREEVERMS